MNTFPMFSALFALLLNGFTLFRGDAFPVREVAMAVKGVSGMQIHMIYLLVITVLTALGVA